MHRLPFHIAGTDSELSLLLEPQCNQQYKVQNGDICNSIAKSHNVPTLVVLFTHFTYALTTDTRSSASVKMTKLMASAPISKLAAWDMFLNFWRQQSNYGDDNHRGSRLVVSGLRYVSFLFFFLYFSNKFYLQTLHVTTITNDSPWHHVPLL